MSRVFVDTAAWLALLNSSDELHKRAQEVRRDLARQKARLATTDFVLIEVADALSTPAFREKTVRFIDRLRTSAIVRIEPASADWLAEGWALYGKRMDKEWGLTDCISMAVMSREGISVVFTSDRHFEQAGFVKLL